MQRNPSVAQVGHHVVSAIESSAREAGFELDPHQVSACESLATAAERITAGDAPGVYLWGPVGRGKTWLLDAFIRCWPASAVRRFHFHRFFRDFHSARHRCGYGPDSVRRAVDELVGNASIVCFDELFAHETGDARMFTAILSELREHRPAPMVVTSNYAPDGLLPDAVFVTSGSTWEEPAVKIDHRAFEAGIALIKRSFDVVPVNGGIDYRDISQQSTRTGFRAGTYRVTLPRSGTDVGGGESVEIRGRTLRALVAADGEVAFDFVELCERPVGAGDIAELAGRFRSWTIDNVPALSACSPEAAQRFVNFVDVLCDADVRLDITSTWTLEELIDPDVGGPTTPPDAARLRSRLKLLNARR